jgi:hypothetical protein
MLTLKHSHSLENKMYDHRIGIIAFIIIYISFPALAKWFSPHDFPWYTPFLVGILFIFFYAIVTRNKE